MGKLKATRVVLALICIIYFLTYVDRVNIGTAAGVLQRESAVRPNLQTPNRLRHLDKLLKRLHANKDELLRMLERPEIPLNTNASENDDIRAVVTKRKVSGGTVSEGGRIADDVMLGLVRDLREAQNLLLPIPRHAPRNPGTAKPLATLIAHNPMYHPPGNLPPVTLTAA
jgi:hypothetical protein